MRSISTARPCKPFLRAISAPFILVASLCLQVHACEINPSRIGKVVLGMSLANIREVYPQATFSRSVDAEGVLYVDVQIAGDTLLSVHGVPDDNEEKINWSAGINFVETSSPNCAIGGAVRPGMSIAAATKVLGLVSGISMSEIESREYVTFSKAPSQLRFRTEDAGIFSKSSRKTRKYRGNAKLTTISISSELN